MRKQQRTPDERLDRIGKSVVRSGGLSVEETEAVASSPFLYAKIRARIEAERQPRAEPQAVWFAGLLVAGRAIPALVIIAVVAFGAFWFTKTNAGTNLPAGVMPGDNRNAVAVGGTCALSSTEECAISTEEVLATLFAEGESQR